MNAKQAQPILSKQSGELFRKTSVEQAIELAYWLRHEIENMRLRLRVEQTELRQLELSMRRVEDILFNLQQEELFKGY